MEPSCALASARLGLGRDQWRRGGDVSTLGAGLAGFLLQAEYSRDLEREADTFAKQFLRAQGISFEHLASILARMEERAGRPIAAVHSATSPRTR